MKLKRYLTVLLLIILNFNIFQAEPNSGLSTATIQFSQPKLMLASFGKGLGGWQTQQVHPRVIGDVDGDGIDDIVGFGGNDAYVVYGKNRDEVVSAGSESKYFNLGGQGFAYSSWDKYPRWMADINGDGKYDICGFAEAGMYTGFSTGNNQFNDPQLLRNHYTPSQGGWTSYTAHPRIFGDANGDGKDDMCVFGSSHATCNLSNGNGFSGGMGLNGFHTADGFTDSNVEPVYAADIDGNGCDDIVGLATDGAYVSWSDCSSFSPKEKIPSITSYVKDRTWSSFDNYPRWFKDMNGDGKADLIGFSCCDVSIAFSQGKTFATPKQVFSQTFSKNYSWTSYNDYPRMIGDFDGDGLNDIVGFSSHGIEIAFNNYVCSHTTRDPKAKCSCKDGYYDKQDGLECPQCYRKCGTCEDGTQNCTTCFNSTRSGANCDCVSGYYDDGTSQSCQACVFPCTNCTSATVCTTCAQSNRTKPECDCDDGYYESNGTCLKCDYKCSTCSGSSTNCLTCSHSTRDDSNSNCLCKSTYFNSGTNAQCTACSFPCVTCTSSSVCETCNGSNRTKPECDCDDGYFQNSSNTCQLCDNTKCGTCSSLTICIVSCVSTCETCNLNGTCKTCVDGKFLSNGTCQSCTNTICATCQTSASQCIDSCNPTCKTCLPDKTCDSCVDGKYLTSSKACDLCDNTKCGTCQNTAINCIQACNSDCETCNIDGSCATCVDGKYLSNGSCLSCDNSTCATCQNQSNQCILSCGNNCKTCMVDASCDSCEDGRYLTNGDCLLCDNTKCGTCQTSNSNCIVACNNDCKTCNLDGSCSTCEDNEFLSNGSCSLCDNSKCATCQTSADNCILNCNSDCKTCNTNKQCLTCEDGRYLNSGQCLSCDNTVCGTCTNTSTQCVKQCNSDCKTCGTDGKCISCQDHQYLKDGACLPCDNTVCGQCNTSATNCTVPCLSSCTTCNTTGQCNSCEDGKYVFQGGCDNCDDTKCGTCVTSNDNCIQPCHNSCKTCKTDGNCQDCDFGFYLNSNICSACDNTKCATCVTTSTNCIDECNSDCKTCLTDKTCDSCVDGKFLTNGQCQVCDDSVCGTCQTSNQNCIQACNSDCKTCNTDGTCKSCENGEYLTNDGKCLQCDNSVCATCQSTSTQCILSCNGDCKTCLVDQTCDSCEDGYFLENGQCKQCDDSVCGTCINNATQCVQQCNSDCKTCNTDGSCKTCESNEYLLAGQCHACGYKCAQCEGSADNCLQCSDSNRDTPVQGSTQCSCSEGYFDTGVAQCEQCDFKCGTCKDSSENCQTCSDESRSMVPKDPSLPVCSCANGYYDEESTGDCLKCKYDNCNCREHNICYECTGTDAEFRSVPTCACITSYYQEDGICQKCNDLCLTCSSKDTCLECQITHQNPQLINLGQGNACGCPEQYYLQQRNNGNYYCKQCGPQCRKCDSEGVCQECLLEDRSAPDCKKPKIQEAQVFSFSMVDQAGNIEEVEGQCNVNCSTCEEAANICITCNLKPFRQDNPPSCSCEKGYFDELNTLEYCQKCSDNCETCDFEDKCNTCVPGQNRSLNSFTRRCECSEGFTESKNSNQQGCVKCFQYQNQCFQKCPDSTIQDEITFKCIDIIVEEKSQSISYIIGLVGIVIAQFLIFGFLLKYSKKLIQNANQIQRGQQLEEQSSGSQSPQQDTAINMNQQDSNA